MNSDLLYAAEVYWNMGLSVVPVKIYPDLTRKGKFGKIPMDPWSLTSPRMSLDKLLTGVDRYGAIGMGVPMDIVVVDLDTSDDGEFSALTAFGQLGENVFDTLKVYTPTGGMHLYYSCSSHATLKTNAKMVHHHIDIRKGGTGFVVLPPSSSIPHNGCGINPVQDSDQLHGSKRYKWDFSFEINNLSSELFKVIENSSNRQKPVYKSQDIILTDSPNYNGKKYIEVSIANFLKVDKGDRNNALNRLVHTLYELGSLGKIQHPKNLDTILYQAGIDVGLDSKEVVATIRSASRLH